LPNGSETEATNTDYIIPENTGFNTLDIELISFSKNKNKSSIVRKPVSVIPASYFEISNIESYKPKQIEISKANFSGGVYQISASEVYFKEEYNYKNSTATIIIKLPGSTINTNSITYNLQYNDSLQAGKAFIWIRKSSWELKNEDFISSNGTLLMNTINGKLHLIFNNVIAHHTNNSGNIYNDIEISGELFCH
jgi:hypothetical protein